jgi:hypothetical protein
MYSRRSTLMACTALVGVWLFIPHAAKAQSASDSEKIQSLERQTELLQNRSRRSRTSSFGRDGRTSRRPPQRPTRRIRLVPRPKPQRPSRRSR